MVSVTGGSVTPQLFEVYCDYPPRARATGFAHGAGVPRSGLFLRSVRSDPPTMENVFTHTICPPHIIRTYLRNLSDTEVNMTLSKRLKRLWSLLTTEEVFDEHGSLGRRSMVRRAPRG